MGRAANLKKIWSNGEFRYFSFLTSFFGGIKSYAFKIMLGRIAKKLQKSTDKDESL